MNAIDVSLMDSETLFASIQATIAKRAADMPTEEDAMAAMQEAFDRLKDLGWKTRGQIAIEQWLPPHLTENVISDAESLSKVCRIFADQLAQNAADLARLAGIER